MHSYTATIGRNVPDMHDQYDDVTGERIQTPMSLTLWHQFVEDVEADMSTALHLDAEPVTVEVHYGKGVWDGVEEESAKITVLAESDRHFGLADLRGYLSELARQYSQDAIALTVGESELC